MGHARALLGLDDPKDQLRLYKRILKEGMSVRAVEQIVREGLAPAGQSARPKAMPNHEYDEFAKNLSQRFSAPVKFSRNADGKGSITFKFSSDDELHALIKAFES